MKPTKCSWCGETTFTLHQNLPVFNPDTDEEELIEQVYICESCNTLHVDNKDIKFIQRDIDNNKLLQTTESNITID